MIYHKKTPWFDITIDEEQRHITIEQRWKISWSYGPGCTRWTDKEKQHFIFKVGKILKHSWGSAFKVHVEGSSTFARLHRKDSFRVIFKIIPSAINWHWKVLANKILPIYEHRSFTTWATREIIIYQDNTKLEIKPAGCRQRVVAHEIGHALGNLDDEYKDWSDYYNDKRSIMNNGMIIRERHFGFILAELNTIIPETNFYL